MTLAAQSEPYSAPEPFSTRTCGHRVPMARKNCPWCSPPRLSAAPLADLLRRHISQRGLVVVSVEIATRLSRDPASVRRQVQKLLQGRTKGVALHLADDYCVALGGVLPVTVWGDEWFDACPVEPYGDEDSDSEVW